MKWKEALALLAAAAVISGSAMFLLATSRTPLPTPEVSEVEACDSCTARHQNLKQLRDALRQKNTGED